MPDNRITVLVLGGTGAMGKSLVKILSDRGYDVYVTSRGEHENRRNLTYIKGNAKDINFLRSILNKRYDVIVDFMSYTTSEFKERADLMLTFTEQYIFISSAWVYAPSDKPLTENSLRLLDACKDKDYLATDEYALSKARQENILFEDTRNNYTIVRPSITYNNNRLQLTIGEKEDWLYRVLHGRSVVFPADMMDVRTSMAYGADVAKVIALLVGNKEAYGETFHVASEVSMTWSEVLDVYQEVLLRIIGHKAEIVYVPDALEVGRKIGREYQIKYARSISRTFDSSKVRSVVGDIEFVSPQIGLAQCLEEFFESPSFVPLLWKAQAYYDKICGENTGLNEFGSMKRKAAYLVSKNILFAGDKKVK